MLGEALAIVHLVLIEVQDVTDDFLYGLRSWRFRLACVLPPKLPAFRSGCSNQGVLAEVSLLELLHGTLTLAFLACEPVAVSYHAVSLD